MMRTDPVQYCAGPSQGSAAFFGIIHGLAFEATFDRLGYRLDANSFSAR